MKHQSIIRPSLTIISFIFLFACKKDPAKVDYINVGGYVIGKETCKGNDADEYWLLDLTVYPNTPQYGDNITVNGTPYSNVIKLKGLDQRLRIVGMKVSIDFKTITPDKITTTSCTVSPSTTYALKEITILNQGEIR
jgi:hypothetical protein